MIVFIVIEVTLSFQSFVIHIVYYCRHLVLIDVVIDVA